MAQPSTDDDDDVQERKKQMHQLVELMTGWLKCKKMDSTTLVSLIKMGAKVQKVLEIKVKVKVKVKASFSGRSTASAFMVYQITDKG